MLMNNSRSNRLEGMGRSHTKSPDRFVPSILNATYTPRSLQRWMTLNRFSKLNELRTIEDGLAVAVRWIAVHEIAALGAVNGFLVFHALEGRALSAPIPVLNNFVQPRLMTVDHAREVFTEFRGRLNYTGPIPMNKQKGDKKAPAYLTALINMLISANIEEMACDYDPRALTTVTFDGAPLRTLARRVDGAFPSAVNPIAVWEIKEYYYTTTFGSRVADGVYETLLDGMELEELRVNEGVNVLHYLMVDDHYTWWECGRSYLCRILDMLHMGYVDEVLFGSEVVERLPVIVEGC